MKKELTMKAVSEIFKLASRINIKPKDIIGMGGDVIKMGTSLFNTKVNPKLTEFINKKGEIPTKIVEQIKVHLRSLKNVSENQLELFKLNLKDIVNAKFPPTAKILDIKTGHKIPAAGITQLETGIKRPGASVAEEMAIVESQMGNIKKTSSKLDDVIKEYENIYKPKKEILPKYKETPGEWVRGQTLGTKEYYLNELRIAYPNHYRTLTGKETTKELKEIIHRLDTEGIPFAKGGIANHFRNK